MHGAGFAGCGSGCTAAPGVISHQLADRRKVRGSRFEVRGFGYLVYGHRDLGTRYLFCSRIMAECCWHCCASDSKHIRRQENFGDMIPNGRFTISVRGWRCGVWGKGEFTVISYPLADRRKVRGSRFAVRGSRCEVRGARFEV